MFFFDFKRKLYWLRQNNKIYKGIESKVHFEPSLMFSLGSFKVRYLDTELSFEPKIQATSSILRSEQAKSTQDSRTAGFCWSLIHCVAWQSSQRWLFDSMEPFTLHIRHSISVDWFFFIIMYLKFPCPVRSSMTPWTFVDIPPICFHIPSFRFHSPWRVSSISSSHLSSSHWSRQRYRSFLELNKPKWPGVLESLAILSSLSASSFPLLLLWAST